MFCPSKQIEHKGLTFICEECRLQKGTGIKTSVKQKINSHKHILRATATSMSNIKIDQ